MKQPKVSIVTVTLNRPSLEDACKSVETQTYRNWHHYVIGDGLPPKDFRHDQRTTFGFSRALGAEEPGANMLDGTPNPLQRWSLSHLDLGDYVCFLDDDNIYGPDFLEKMVRKLERTPDAGIVLCAVEDLRHGQNLDGYPEYYRCDNSGFLMKREVAKSIEFPRASLNKNVIQDVEFIRIAASRFGWVNLPEVLVVFGYAPNTPTPRGGVKLLESWEGPIKAQNKIRVGNYRGGIADLEEAVHLDPNDGWSIWSLAEAHLMANERESATEWLTKWLELSEREGVPKHHWITAASVIAKDFLRLKSGGTTLDQALELVEETIATKPDEYGCGLYCKALYLVLSGQEERGLDLYRETLSVIDHGFPYDDARWKLVVLVKMFPRNRALVEARKIVQSK